MPKVRRGRRVMTIAVATAIVFSAAATASATPPDEKRSRTVAPGSA